jgi:RNA polymerase sigma-70 factor, ECF subfamily
MYFLTQGFGKPDIEDALGDVLVSMLTGEKAVTALRNPKGYLIRSTRNRLLDQQKHQGVAQKAKEQGRLPLPTGSPPPDDAAYSGELDNAVGDAIATLPRRCREVFRLSRMKGLSHAEIAEALGITRSTVKNQVAKALKILRSKLTPLLGLPPSRWRS